MAEQHQGLSEPQVYEVLKTVKYPGYSRDVVSFGMVKGIQVDGQDLQVTLQITTNQQEIATKLQQATAEAVLSQPNTKTTQEMHKVAAAVSKILGRHSAPAPIKILNSHATLRSRTSVPPAPSGETAGGGYAP